MDDYWDNEDQWQDESRCIVCKTRSPELVCSATCEDMRELLHLRQSPVMDWEGLGDFIAETHEPRSEYA